MSKLSFILVAASAVLAMASCSKEAVQPDKSATTTITAVADGLLTKTVLGADGKAVEWVANDSISVFAPSESSFTNAIFKTTESGASAAFTGPALSTKTGLYGLYPCVASATCAASGVITATIDLTSQKAVAGSFAAGANLAVAATDNAGKLAFKNAGSLLKVTVDLADPSAARKIVIKANGGSEALVPAGAVTVSYNGGEPTVTGATSNTVTLVADNGLTNGDYYAWVLPVEFNAGITVTISDEWGRVLEKKSTKSGNVAVRNKGLNLGAFAGTLAYPAFEDHSSEDTPYIYYGGVKYPVVKMKDDRIWMAANLRYVPDGIAVRADFTANTGIWYPGKLSWNGTKASAAVSKDAAVIEAQGLLYTEAVAMSATLPTGDFADAEATQGICPKGWSIPTAQEWIDLVGACSNSAKNNTSAPYYDQNLNGASLAALNADGMNLLPYPYVNGGKSYLATVTNKTNASSPFYCMNGMIYYASSTGHSATQSYAAMITNNATKSSVNVAYNNLTNGVAVRCIKDKVNGTSAGNENFGDLPDYNL